MSLLADLWEGSWADNALDSLYEDIVAPNYQTTTEAFNRYYDALLNGSDINGAGRGVAVGGMWGESQYLSSLFGGLFGGNDQTQPNGGLGGIDTQTLLLVGAVGFAGFMLLRK